MPKRILAPLFCLLAGCGYHDCFDSHVNDPFRSPLLSSGANCQGQCSHDGGERCKCSMNCKCWGLEGHPKLGEK